MVEVIGQGRSDLLCYECNFSRMPHEGFQQTDQNCQLKVKDRVLTELDLDKGIKI